MAKSGPFSRAAFMIWMTALTCLGQAPVSSWDRVKAIAPGMQVRVAIGTEKPIVGALEGVTDTDLTITQGTSPKSFPRTQITSIAVKTKGHRLRHAMIGLGVGTGAGLGIGYGIGRAEANDCSNHGGWFCGLDTAGGAVLGTAIGIVGGTLIGVFWPTGGWQKVYTR